MIGEATTSAMVSSPCPRPAQAAHQVELGLALGQVGPSLDQLVVEVGQLLVVEDGSSALGADQVALGAEPLDRLLGLADLRGQRRQPLVEPDRRPVGVEQLALELLVDIDLGQAVGDQRRLGRALGGVLDRDQVGAALGADEQAAEEAVDRLLPGEARRLALEDGDRLLVQPGGDQPFLRDQRFSLRSGSVSEIRKRRLALRQQRRVELRIVEQLELVHHPRDERPRLEQPDLGLQLRALGRQAASIALRSSTGFCCGSTSTAAVAVYFGVRFLP